MSSATIQAEVIAKVAADRRIPYPEEIAVDASDVGVTLRGTVGSFAQRRAAGDDARQVEGVTDVFNELQVRVLDEYAREDAEIRGAALQSLMWDAELHADSIDVKVEDGWVTLSGQVEFQFQSDDAFDDVASLSGVTGITNKIKVVESL
jgi:osmotically-inducible protein OsmY